MHETLICKAKRKDWEKLPKEDWWVVGYVVRYGFTKREKYYIVPEYASDLYSIEILPDTICQNTGMRDYKGVQICEHDKCVVTRPGVLAFGSIKYGKGGFYFVEDKTGSILRLWDLQVNNYRIEVEGNMFD